MTVNKIPTIDLNSISNESQLVPIVKGILMNHDTFLLKNYANQEALEGLLEQLQEIPPVTDEGFDPNFTGALKLDEGNTLLEQYIINTGSLQFPREILNPYLQKIYSRLFKLGMHFAQLCLQAVVSEPYTLNEKEFSTKLTRYYTNVRNSVLDLQFDYQQEYVTHTSTGIITIFPSAEHIQYKYNGQWKTVNYPDCILIHTGTLLSNLSNGLHATSPIKFATDTTNLTISLPLDTVIKGDTLANLLLKQQIREFPKVAEKFYPRELAEMNLVQKVQLYKEVFNVSDSVLSLYSMSKPTNTAPELYNLLPQISNMLKKKITQEMFLKMLYLWKDCYIIEVNSRAELTIKPPSTRSLMTLSNKSRKLEYVERADCWLNNALQQPQIPVDVPICKISKRKCSDSSSGCTTTNISTLNPTTPTKKNRSKGYISNSAEKFFLKEAKPDENGSSLLERIRQKERKASALLSQRERQYQQFLKVKIVQVFDILFSLPQGKPYTSTHLSSLITDSLQDSNNPIGDSEAQEILLKLQDLLQHRIKVTEVEGGLKVFKWDILDKQELKTILEHQ